MAQPTATGSCSSVREAARQAAALVAGGGVVALTGAGISTDSGIPDYRGPGSLPRSPMTGAEFRSGPGARQRYWARSHLGWRRMRQARPNDGHRALAELQASGVVSTVITQNVDGLHQAAGSAPVIDLHGRIDRVICLDCAAVLPRADLEREHTRLNPGFGTPGAAGTARAAGDEADIRYAPDGDADLEDTGGFVVAPCPRCAGVLKPDVVFFGENVPPQRVSRCCAAVDGAGAVLVVGSSLTVMSGFRFVRQAAARGIPTIIVNRGPTRGDPLAALCIDGGCSEVLRELADALP
jgi:NAD-dependent SIR2 family protein deacetylase